MNISEQYNRVIEQQMLNELSSEEFDIRLTETDIEQLYHECMQDVARYKNYQIRILTGE